MHHIAVIDIGKTNAKVALVDLESLAEIAVMRTPNAVRHDGPYPHHDVGLLWAFILEALAALHRAHGVTAISVTTHGATAALISDDGELALPILDYEHRGPETVARAYDEVRPSFGETGSPRLPMGLNLGAQLFWQQRFWPDRFGEKTSLLMYPQYWVHRLTGIAANEVTSLGCHTDLWNPTTRNWSRMVDRLGWLAMMAPVHAARQRIGSLQPGIAARTGLPPQTPVYCGIHDSNASLLPHLMRRRRPFSVVSTGTWVVAMAVGGRAIIPDPERDTLINVNADGDPVPSARFMGGREFEIVTAGPPPTCTQEDVDAVLATSVFLLPSVQPGCGPFPSAASLWINAEGATAGQRHVALSFYLAAMTSACLALIGADGETIVEGPFSDNQLFIAMLASASGRRVATGTGGGTGTSVGAALLARGMGGIALDPSDTVRFSEPDARFAAYADRWNSLVSNRSL